MATAFGLVTLLILAAASRGAAAPKDPAVPQHAPYVLKAAFIYQFVKLVEWPRAGAVTPLTVGVWGHQHDPSHLGTIDGKRVGDRTLRLKEVTDEKEAADCQVLFIMECQKARTGKILESLRGKSVLTIGETPDFAQQGGILNFVIPEKERKIRYEVNPEAAARAGLKLNPKLVELGTVVRDKTK